MTISKVGMLKDKGFACLGARKECSRLHKTYGPSSVARRLAKMLTSENKRVTLARRRVPDAERD
jgi:hypothetical protein